MTTNTKPIPPGFHTVTPHLILRNAAAAIDFYKKAFGAEELSRMPMPDGRLMHASIKIGDSIVFLCDEFPEHGCGLSPQSLKDAHATMHVYVEDVDASFKRAVDAGAEPVMPPQDMFWGDRYGRILDPFGQPWSFASHKRDLTEAEVKSGMLEACSPAQEACTK
jgi:PhnB protein